ncbi:ATP-binding cassette domain-containing protein [Spirulina subsalsa FACHB-351]|uniref:ATP-binding cassette domain-containing protein n=1 Tax=Spirulina subsalsa FACHB-351 TaxID=234711 RepID=A0ABT3L5C4_9CYAN|nr:ATP-binding cassette domain-containing protein [Spirulina subsalsa]MCW6036190.1 ATP-binding cassette domain-containing protein [Spirulina subsalsa FACHB-351]
MNTQGKRTVVAVPYIVLNNQGQTQQFNLTGDFHQLGRDPQVDLRVPDDWGVVSSRHAVFRRVGQDYFIYDGDGQHHSTNGLLLNHTRITPTQGCQLHDGMELRIGQNPKNLVILTYFDPNSQGVSAPKKQSISLKNRSVLIGRDPNATLVLDAPTISRTHAIIDTDSAGRYVLRDYSSNGVFLDGQKVKVTAVLSSGSTLRIGPYTLVLQGDELLLSDQGNHLRLDAYNVTLEVQDQKGKKKRLLEDISLPIEPGQLVALVGGSGAGKSTLMRTLLGIQTTTEGNVFLNGEHLQTNFNIYRTQIGYVPQDDIIHRELTVKEVLTYAAKLRLPPDADIAQIVQQALEQIEMAHRQDILVSQLSGGQRKRVSIGVELLADPKLFFLDEPTSGLDPGLDQKMMVLLRKLADQGRTIVLVTHATANIKLCDRIVFLGMGGRLCYFGPPDQALSFFQTSQDFADIYNHLEDEQTVIAESSRYRRSSYYPEYIETRLSGGSRLTGGTAPQKVRRSPLEQLAVLTQRYRQLILRDRINLVLALLTAPIGISLITVALRDQNPLILPPEPDSTLAPLALRVLFVFTCASLWVGLSSSLQEIVKEAAIYARERLVNLEILTYLGSKNLVLGGLALVQTVLITLTILIGFKSPAPELLPWILGLGITTFLTLFCCISLGLTISAVVKNSSQANSALPLLLLPQIIFSGVLFKMEGIGRYLSWLMLSRWSVGAYGILVNVNGMVPEPMQLPDGSMLPQPFEITPVYEATWDNLLLNWGVLGLHTIVYWLVCCLFLKYQTVLNQWVGKWSQSVKALFKN